MPIWGVWGLVDEYTVIGSGADTCYPKENHFLYDKIKVSGGIISELMPGTDPQCFFR